MEIYLIRHTTPEVKKGICYGQSDLELADSFHKELKRIKALLPDYFDAIYTSPLTRCKQLADQLSNYSSTQIEDSRLIELNFGDWEMKAWNDISNKELETWMNDFVTIAPTNGESMLDLQKRVISWLNEIQTKKHQQIAVITHSGVIRVINAYLNQVPLHKAFEVLTVEYGEVLTYSISEN